MILNQTENTAQIIEQATQPVGGCSCGAVRYQLLAPPLIVHCCHCSYCQRETGSAFVINALIESNALRLLQGNPECIDTPSHSGLGQRVWRCPDCHVALYSHYKGFKSVVSFVRVGTLDKSAACQPDIHIYTSTRVPWVTLSDDARAVPEYYSMREVWSADSIERYRKLTVQPAKHSGLAQ